MATALALTVQQKVVDDNVAACEGISIERNDFSRVKLPAAKEEAEAGAADTAGAQTQQLGCMAKRDCAWQHWATKEGAAIQKYTKTSNSLKLQSEQDVQSAGSLTA